MAWPKGRPAHNRIPQPSLTSRVCNTCSEEKDVSSGFYGASHKCRACTLKAAKENRDPEKLREHSYRSRYGIGIEDYDRMLAEQGGVCAICKSDDPTDGARKRGSTGIPKYFCVDHNHETGKVRGLLCHRCNMAIGYIGESTDWLEKAVNFLETYGS